MNPFAAHANKKPKLLNQTSTRIGLVETVYGAGFLTNSPLINL